MSRIDMDLPASGIDEVASLPPGLTLSVIESVYLPAAPARVWNLIRDFDGWQGWHPAVARTDMTAGSGNAPGAVRVLTTHDGAKFTERLLTHAGAARSYSYSIIESPLRVAGYVAKLEVRGEAHAATVVWSSTYKLAAGAEDSDVRRAIVGIYRAGLDHLAALLR